MIKEITNIDINNNFSLQTTKTPFSKYFGYFINDKLVAYIDTNIIYDRAEICDFYVKEEYRNQKIGSKLLQHFISYCQEQELKNITLEVKQTNEIALFLYKKNNFVEKAIRKGYYNGIDGILMELII